MKQLFTIVVLLLMSIFLQAQNAIAKIKYEQAEEAFIKNDFATTISKLDEVQKLLGSSNPKILYLRLMASKGIIAGGKYDYDFLANTRQDVQTYLTKYSEVEGIDEKIRDVYFFSEALDKLPKTKNLYDEKQAAIKQKEDEAKQKKAEELRKISNAITLVVDSLAKLIEFRPGLTQKEFLALNPEWSKKTESATFDNITCYSRKASFFSYFGSSYCVKDEKVITYNSSIKPFGSTSKNNLYYAKLKSWVYTTLAAGGVVENVGIGKNVIGDANLNTTHFAKFNHYLLTGEIGIEVTIMPK